jgi:hypothetical protein
MNVQLQVLEGMMLPSRILSFLYMYGQSITLLNLN